MVTEQYGKDHGGEVEGRLPEYALKIRELRKTFKLTQDRFSKKLKPPCSRVTAARWETGRREPNAESYEALARFAEAKRPDLAKYFAEKSKSVAVNPEEKIKRFAALHRLEAIEEAAKSGSARSKGLLELADRDPVEVSKYLDAQLRAARDTLTNGEFSVAFRRINEEFAAVQDIRLGRGVREGRAAEVQRREEKRWQVFEKQRDQNLAAAAAGENSMFDELFLKATGLVEKLALVVEEGVCRPGGEAQKLILEECEQLLPKLGRFSLIDVYQKWSSRIIKTLDMSMRTAGKLDGPNDEYEMVVALYHRLKAELKERPVQ